MKLSGWKAIGAAATVVGAAFAFATDSAAASAGPPAIQFANEGGIYDWRANGDRGMWVQAVNRQWYYATFMAPCYGLDTTERVGFLFGPSGQFDRWSSIVVPREARCFVRTFDHSGSPPSREMRVG